MSEKSYTISLSRHEVLLVRQMLGMRMKEAKELMQQRADEEDAVMVMAHEYCLSLCEKMHQKMPVVAPLE